MKHLNPGTPASARGGSSSALPRTTPPQAAQSTQALLRAAARLASRAATLIVSGTQFKGMSTSVVTPPAAAARVAVSKALPVAARIVDVYMGIDEAGEKQQVAKVVVLPGTGQHRSRHELAAIFPPSTIKRRGAEAVGRQHAS